MGIDPPYTGEQLAVAVYRVQLSVCGCGCGCV